MNKKGREAEDSAQLIKWVRSLKLPPPETPTEIAVTDLGTPEPLPEPTEE